MAMVALAGIVPVTAMMSANLNTSQMIDDRRQVQDAADALAMMHGTWTARALNIISMNNVTTAQLLSVAVGSEALFMTTTQLTATAALAEGYIVSHGVQHCRPQSSGPAAIVEAIIWTAPCTAWHTAVSLPAVLAQVRAADINSDFDPVHGIETARKALDAIDGMNRALAARHPRAMAEIAEDYYSLLDIDDHHFADPCDGPDVANCTTANTGDGMALPIEPAQVWAHAQLYRVMRTGMTSTDTTFRARGFPVMQGPLSRGGTERRPHLRDHINHVTEIGDALYEFKRFYDSPISDLPRHPLLGPGTAVGGGYTPPGEPPDEESPFDENTADILDTLEGILESANDVNEMILGVLRNLPLAFDRHPTWANLQLSQSRRGPNSFTRNFTMLDASILMPDFRPSIPLGFDFDSFSLVFAVAVPETYQLEGIDPRDPLPPVEYATMPEAFHILAYTLKEKSRRLASAVLTSPVISHTGYGQTGVYNPDGATLYTQNWQTRLMPATRMDDPGQAGGDLAQQARSGFDELAEDLRHVRDTASWGRVHAH